MAGSHYKKPDSNGRVWWSQKINSRMDHFASMSRTFACFVLTKARASANVSFRPGGGILVFFLRVFTVFMTSDRYRQPHSTQSKNVRQLDSCRPLPRVVINKLRQYPPHRATAC